MSGTTFELHERQGQAFLTPATEVLYGGAAGGGKSHLLRVASIAWAKGAPGLQVYLFRRTYPELKRNHLEGPTSYPALLAAEVNAGRAAVVENEIRFPNRSRIFLNHLQHDKNVTLYQGAEIHVLLMDELTHFPDASYRYLRGRVRLGAWKPPADMAHLFPRILCGTNPGGVGHTWVKRAFVEAGPWKIRRMGRAEGGMLRQYIPARMSDNPSLFESDPDYDKRLEGLGDPLLVRAMREGDWDIIAGAAFGEFRRELHTCRPFPIPQHWEIWRGADDGFTSPAACLWLTRDPLYGTVFVVRELYRAKMLPDEYASRIKEIDGAIQRITAEGEVVTNEALGVRVDGILDSAAFASTGTREAPRGTQLNNLGARFKPADKWPGSRVHEKQNVHRFLARNKSHPNRRPSLIFFEHCRELIDEIAALPVDEKNPEDVDTEAPDHAYDALRYGLQKIGRGRRGTAKIAGI